MFVQLCCCMVSLYDLIEMTLNAMDCCFCCNNVPTLFLYRRYPLKLGLNDFSGYRQPVNKRDLGTPFLYFGFIPARYAHNKNQQGLMVCVISSYTRGSHAFCKVLDFFPGFFRRWKVVENRFGPGESWKLKLKVLGSTGK